MIRKLIVEMSILNGDLLFFQQLIKAVINKVGEEEQRAKSHFVSLPDLQQLKCCTPLKTKSVQI